MTLVMTTADAAKLARTTPRTVEREIGRGNLEAQKIGGIWLIADEEGRRWAGQFKPYASLRKDAPPPSD